MIRQVADGLGSATATCVLATDGLVATVVQTLLIAGLGARKNMGIGASLLKADLTLLIADLGARKKRGIGAFLATDGLNATVVKRGAAVGQRGNAWGGSDI